MNNEHDKTYKSFLKNKKSFLELLQGFVDEEWTKKLSEDNIDAVDKSIILRDYAEKEADIIYKLTLDGEDYYFYILLELQSSVDFTMPYRLLSYMTALWQEIFINVERNTRESKKYILPAIIPMVLYNGTNNWTAKMSFKEMQTGHQMFGKHLVDFEYILFDVNRYTEEDLIIVGNFISAIFLMDKDYDNDKKDVIYTLKKTVNILKKMTPEQWSDYSNWLKQILIPKLPEESKKEVKELLEQTNVKEVDQMVMNIERNLDKMIERGKLEGKAEGKLEGKLEGKAEGKLEGKLEGKAEGKLEGKLEGKAEGKLEGKLEGKAEGKLEGKLEGKAEGIEQGVLNVAKRMVERGLNYETIQEYTGLSIEEIKHCS